MSKIKQKPFVMIHEGMEHVLDKLVVLHKNVDSSNTARVLVYGSARQKKHGLIYELEGTTYSGNDGDSIPADTWVLITAVATSTSAFSGMTAGEVYYNGTGSPVSLTNEAVGGTEDACSVIVGVELNKGLTTATGSVIQAKYIPCESIVIEIHDAENLHSNYGMNIITRTPVDVPEAT